ncbi:MAG: cytoskeletal protein RodZ [Pelotomaculum sp. PtaU1.Bin035]|nr:MAG: cytoskeletal protein RodZ [Pelotomaculum sp. PtaU1.Bin035]
MGIGQKLKEARENRGLTLESVEGETKIRRKYLQAMEDEQFQLLPGPVYAKSFLKNYARFLALNVEEALETYNEYFTAETPMEPAVDYSKTEKNTNIQKRPRWFYFVAAAVIVVAGVVFLINYVTGIPGGNNVADNNKGGAEISEQAPLAPGQQNPALLQQTAGASNVSLDLNVKNNRCWMQVMVDGNPAFEGTLSAGQSKRFEGKEKINITLGNAGVVEALFNGQNLGLLGDPGEVISREFKSPPHG